MQNFIEFHWKYFSCCKKVAFRVWILRTNFGPIGGPKDKAIEPWIQFSKTRPHFMQF